MRKIVTLVVCLAVATLFAMLLFYLPALAQSQLSLQAKDPGVRAGSVNAGQALSTLSPGQSQYFTDIQLQQLRELPCATCGGRFQSAG
jgi:hypothetical protein